jgi:methionine-rich copper-binding protein CopC
MTVHPKTVARKLLFATIFLSVLNTNTHGANAHAEIAKTYPVKNAVLSQSPNTVWIEFGESLLTLNTKVVNTLTVTNAQGKRVDKSPTIISGARATTKIFEALKKGKYLVTYRVVSEDGHPVKASYYFSVK